MSLASAMSTRHIAGRSRFLGLTIGELGVCIFSRAGPALGVHAAARPTSQVRFTIPAGNVAVSGPVLDDRSVAYGIAQPRLHRPVCVSCGEQPFTNFRVQVYVRGYQRHPFSIKLSQPRLLFHGLRGAQIGLYSLSANWLVYDTTTVPGRWQLLARNVVTGRVILLDSPQMEGERSRFLHAGGAILFQLAKPCGALNAVCPSYVTLLTVDAKKAPVS